MDFDVWRRFFWLVWVLVNEGGSYTIYFCDRARRFLVVEYNWVGHTAGTVMRSGALQLCESLGEHVSLKFVRSYASEI